MNQNDLQPTLADQLLHPTKQNTKTVAILTKMESIIDSNFTEKLGDLKVKTLIGDEGYTDDRIKIISVPIWVVLWYFEQSLTQPSIELDSAQSQSKNGRIRAVVEHHFASMNTHVKAL